MCGKITKNKVIIFNITQTIVFGALTTGAIIGAIAAGTTLAIVALSVGAAVAGIFTLFSLANVINSCYINREWFKGPKMSLVSRVGWLNVLTLLALLKALKNICWGKHVSKSDEEL